MAMRKRHELLGHDQHAHAHAVQYGVLVEVHGVVVDPADQVLDLVYKGVVDGR